MKDTNDRYDVIVIGAGLTGLTTAYYLSKSEKRFLVLESMEKEGGVIQTQKEGPFTYECGPNTGIIGQPEVAELFADLGDQVEPEIAKEAVKRRLILKNGKWEPLPSGLLSAVKTPLFSLADKIRLLGEPFRAKGTNPDESLKALVLRRMGKSFLDYAIDPFILGVYSGDPDKLLTRHAFPKLYRLEQDYGSFIGGTLKKSFQKKSDREKLATREIFSCKGGLSNLTDALLKGAGREKFRFGCINVRINKMDDHFVVSYTSSDGSITMLRSKKVITTTGAHALPGLFPAMNQLEISVLNQIRYAPVVEIALGFTKWTGRKLDAFGGLIPHRENRELLGVLFLSAFLENRAPEGGALITLFMGGVRKPDWILATDEEILRTVSEEIKDLMELEVFDPSFVKISRYTHAIPQYGIESDEKIRTLGELMKKNPGLIIGGNLIDGIGMADRIRQGRLMAAEALES
jgi:protoporphyrinogen/coproporphyrinogen III oxidase